MEAKYPTLEIEMRSSYIQNNYGPIFERTAQIFLPHKVVELGVLDGYSTLWLARGAKRAMEIDKHRMHINAYDLWEDYQYKHGSMQKVQAMLEEEGVSEYVTLHKKDAFKVYLDYQDHSVCLLHVDISNNGDVFNRIVEQWNDKLTYGGMILFEGGSEERDKVGWMLEYGKDPIRPEVLTNKTINDCYIYATYDAFPSLSIFRKHS